MVVVKMQASAPLEYPILIFQAHPGTSFVAQKITTGIVGLSVKPTRILRCKLSTTKSAITKADWPVYSPISSS